MSPVTSTSAGAVEIAIAATTADEGMEPVAAVPVGTASLPKGGRIVEIRLPATEAATTVFRAAEHGYRHDGPGRDLILEPPDGDGIVVFELQLPLVSDHRATPHA